MAHPMAGQAKASQKRRLGALQAKSGKAWGSSSMYKKASLPKKNAGTQREYTISGGSAKKRPDRFAFGGGVGGKKRSKPRATTNIIISHAGGRGGTGGGGGAGPTPPGALPVPVPRPVPVPVGAGAPPVGPSGPLPVRLAGPPPVGAAPIPPVGPAGLPAGGALPPVRPPGMKAGGAVKKAAKGGFLKESPGKAYKGFPHSPTSKTNSTVSARKDGGGVSDDEVEPLEGGGYKRGGNVHTHAHKHASASGVAVEEEGHGFKKGGDVKGDPGGYRRPGNIKGLAEQASYGGKTVKKRQFGGGLGMATPQTGGMGLGGTQASVAPPGGGGLLGAFPGRSPVPAQKGPPTISGRPMFQAQPLTVPQPRLASAALQRPAPGTTVGYQKGGAIKKQKGGGVEGGGAKRGGKVHSDAPEDRKLFGKMLKEKGITKRKDGGGVGFSPKNQNSTDPGLEGTIYHNQGKGYARGGLVTGQAGAGSGVGRLHASKAKQSVKGEL